MCPFHSLKRERIGRCWLCYLLGYKYSIFSVIHMNNPCWDDWWEIFHMKLASLCQPICFCCVCVHTYECIYISKTYIRLYMFMCVFMCAHVCIWKYVLVHAEHTHPLYTHTHIYMYMYIFGYGLKSNGNTFGSFNFWQVCMLGSFLHSRIKLS